jgi:ElaB/YqjD/DUF883 family membrane-anchored ribosome-binding protein
MARKDKDAPDERTRRLEALRDDCRRNSADPIPLWRFEGEPPVIGGGRFVRAALDRLGEILVADEPARTDELRRDREAAIEALLKGIPFRTDVVIETSLEDGPPSARDLYRRQRVPDIIAAIAAKCEELLRTSGSKVERLHLEEFRHKAMFTLQRLRRVLRREPTNEEIAEAMQVHPSGISRRLANDPTWIKARAMDGRAPRAVNLEGEGVGLAESDRKPNAIEGVFYDSQAPAPKRVSAKRRQD